MNRKKYSVNEILSILEDDPTVTSANIFILPPDNPNCSDEDSADEENPNSDNLTRSQLEAPATATVHRGLCDTEYLGDDDENISSKESNAEADTPTTSETPQPIPALDAPQPPTSPSSGLNLRRRKTKLQSEKSQV